MKQKKIKEYWVYILLCENNSYYTGYTHDLQKRYRSHVDGTGRCKYTRSFKPQMIAQCWKINGSKSFAMQLERYIKKSSKLQKKKFILKPSSLSTDSRLSTVSKRLRKQYEKNFS